MPHKTKEDRRKYESTPEFLAKKATYMREVYYPKKRAERLAYMKSYQQNNKIQVSEYAKTYYEKNRDRLLIAAKAYRDGPGRVVNQEWRDAHRGSLNERNRKYRDENPEKIRAYKAQYIKDHPEESRHWTSTRRARKIGNGGSHTLDQWLAKVDLLGYCCVYCGREDLSLHKDHKVPLSRGGTDDITNIVPACQNCNNRKGRRTAHEFIELR